MTTARKVQLGVTFALVALVALLAVMFTLQNMSRMSDLSLDLYFGAWHLGQPWPVPWLLWTAFASGFVAAGGLALVLRLGSSRRRQGYQGGLARADVGRTDDDDWT